MSITLRSLSRAELQVIAESGVPDGCATRMEAGALPPAFVARRSLSQLAAGKDPYWCSPFHILREADGWIVGGCGFKDVPQAGRVEIGYGVAAACRNSGVATLAVLELLRLAFATDEVREVLAHISPANAASARVAEKLGFAILDMITDDTGEPLLRWLAERSSLSRGLAKS